MEDAAKVHGNPNASGDDMLEINAGGKVIVAKRSTLTQHMLPCRQQREKNISAANVNAAENTSTFD